MLKNQIVKINYELAKKWVSGKKVQECLVAEGCCKGNGNALMDQKICPACFRGYFDKKTGRNLAVDEVKKVLYIASLEVNALSTMQKILVKRSAQFLMINCKTWDKENGFVNLSRAIAKKFCFSYAPVYEVIKTISLSEICEKRLKIIKERYCDLGAMTRNKRTGRMFMSSINFKKEQDNLLKLIGGCESQGEIAA